MAQKKKDKKKAKSVPETKSRKHTGKKTDEKGKTHEEKKRKISSPVVDEPPRTRPRIVPPARSEAKGKALWSDRSNVGNLSVREKMFLSTAIFVSVVFAWGLLLSISLCGSTPPICAQGQACSSVYVEKLAVCRTLWSTFSLVGPSSAEQSLAIQQNELVKMVESLRLDSEAQNIKVVQLEQANRTLSRQVGTLRENLLDEEKRVDLLKQQLAEVQQNSTRESRALLAELAALQQTSQNDESKIEDLNSQLRKSESTQKDLKSFKESLAKDLASMSTERDELSSNLTALQRKLDTLLQEKVVDERKSASQCNEVQSRLDALQKKHDAALAQTQQLSDQLKSEKLESKKLRSLSADHDSLQSKFDALQVKVDKLTTTEQELQTKGKTLEQNLNSVSKERDNLQLGLRSLQGKYDLLQKERGAENRGKDTEEMDGTTSSENAFKSQNKKPRNIFARIFKRREKVEAMS